MLSRDFCGIGYQKIGNELVGKFRSQDRRYSQLSWRSWRWSRDHAGIHRDERDMHNLSGEDCMIVDMSHSAVRCIVVKDRCVPVLLLTINNESSIKVADTLLHQ